MVVLIARPSAFPDLALFNNERRRDRVRIGSLRHAAGSKPWYAALLFGISSSERLLRSQLGFLAIKNIPPTINSSSGRLRNCALRRGRIFLTNFRADST